MGHQQVMVDSIDELFKIEIHNPYITLTHVLARTPNRNMSAFAGTKPEAIRTKMRVKKLCEHLQESLLDQAVQCGWYP